MALDGAGLSFATWNGATGTWGQFTVPAGCNPIKGHLLQGACTGDRDKEAPVETGLFHIALHSTGIGGPAGMRDA